MTNRKVPQSITIWKPDEGIGETELVAEADLRLFSTANQDYFADVAIEGTHYRVFVNTQESEGTAEIKLAIKHFRTKHRNARWPYKSPTEWLSDFYMDLPWTEPRRTTAIQYLLINRKQLLQEFKAVTGFDLEAELVQALEEAQR